MTVLSLTTLQEYRRFLMLSGALLGAGLGCLAWIWIVAGPLLGAIAGFIFVFLALRIAREIAQRRGPAAASVE